MSNDVDRKNEPTLEQVERILSRKNSEEGVPTRLRPQKLHRLYHNIKLPHYKDPHKLKRFKRWEEKVSKRIAEYYFDYTQTSFDIKSFMSRSNKSEERIRHKARANKAKVSLRKIDKVRDYFKNTSHAWLIENASYRKKDYDSFRKILYNYTLTDEYLKKTHEAVCKKVKKKKYEGDGKALWEKIHKETKELTREEVRKKFCDVFGEEYWEGIHEPYLKEIREVTNEETRKISCKKLGEIYWEGIHEDYLKEHDEKAWKKFYKKLGEETRKEICNKQGVKHWDGILKDYLKGIQERTGKKAGKKYCEEFNEEFREVSHEDLKNGFRNELDEFFPNLYLAHRKPRKGPYISDNAFVMKEYYSRSKKGIVHLVRMLHQENDISSSEADLMYPFLNINRLVLYFWLEQIEPILSPKMILAELRSDKNIGKYELDIFLIWLWEVVHNTKEYNNINTIETVKEKILQLLADLYYQALGKELFKDKDDISRRWKKFRWMKNNAKNARLKPLLDNYSPYKYKSLRTKYNLPYRKRLDDIISKQTKS